MSLRSANRRSRLFWVGGDVLFLKGPETQIELNTLVISRRLTWYRIVAKVLAENRVEGIREFPLALCPSFGPSRIP